MRISDWSSDVCSSDLDHMVAVREEPIFDMTVLPRQLVIAFANLFPAALLDPRGEPVWHDELVWIGAERLRLDPDRPVPLIVYPRSEERRVGKECVSTCKSRWSP